MTSAAQKTANYRAFCPVEIGLKGCRAARIATNRKLDTGTIRLGGGREVTDEVTKTCHAISEPFELLR